jgi:glutamine synthetase
VACTDDLFECTPTQLAARGIAPLPQSLAEAIDALEANSVVRAALGDTLSAEFIRLKRDEWQGYCSHISGWEMQRYAATF